MPVDVADGLESTVQDTVIVQRSRRRARFPHISHDEQIFDVGVENLL
jgi:hypothetical protein